MDKIIKSRKLFSVASVIFLCGMMSVAFQNCARARFLIDPAAKSEALGKESVFDRSQGDDGQVVGALPGDDGAIPGGNNTPGDDSNIGGQNPDGIDPNIPVFPGMGNDPNIPVFPGMGNDPNIPIIPGMGNDPNTPIIPGIGNDPSVPNSNVSVSFTFECSNVKSQSVGGNVLTSEALKIVIVNNFNMISCELTGDFRSQILNNKKLTFTPCANLAPGRYKAHVLDANTLSSSFLMKELTQDDIRFTKNADGSYTNSTSKVEILYDYNKDHSLYAGLNGGTSTALTQASCDSRVSPLIISMNSQSRGIKLTAPLDGIQFDILGENSFPKAHDKKQISWLMADQEYYFIVLPNKDGQVLGINEMFGDNTRGPDGKFSANGYAALRKYDDDKDALITEDDAVFGDLRLWSDKNRDGIADQNELFSMKEKSMSVIDLRYDRRYKETDQYGNQTLMKSVVKTEDGKLHLMFDLWFRYLNITK